ncbi:hypothetical protein [Paracoccus beibuensis]|uniref:hypothetical protein n=1 Tax=Paracoccus beibuensis TaxID=547602 RepID=UPI0022407C82|nr:hypothetical protein [Paracoccus beibuensis]
MRPHDPTLPPIEADRTSHTRFEPRPIPDGHRTEDAPLSRDGRHARPAPSTTATVIVWGGVALGVAGLTVAATMAARRLAGTDRPAPRMHGPTHAPRFADMDEVERDEIRRRVRAQAMNDERAAARLRAEAAQTRHPRGNIAQDLTRTAAELTNSLNGVATSISQAFESFRGVSRQANSILADFVIAADQLKSILNAGPGPRPVAPENRPEAAGADDAARMHRL